MKLIQALRYSLPGSIAFVGAGGKTSALFSVAREISQSNGVQGVANTVLVTTSTHLGAWQAGQADHFFCVTSEQQIDTIAQKFPSGIVLITSKRTGDLLEGLSPILIEKVHRLAQSQSLPLLIEADGAHTRPLKAPATHEPAIPIFVNQVVVVAGLNGLGKPLSAETVHRPERYASLTRLKFGDIITPVSVVDELMDQQGGLKNIPENARRVVLLNQADTIELQAQAKTMSGRLSTVFDACIIASLKSGSMDSSSIRHEDIDFQNDIHAVLEPIAGIILAAGGSNRFGEPKQLLRWKGLPFVRHVALAALNAGLRPVVVVVGCSSTDVKSSIEDLPIRIINNESWNAGMSTSVRQGLRALPTNLGGAIFLQADQPQIPPTLIRSLVEAHQASLHPIISPQINGQRGNPVLFDQITFPKLRTLEGDIGGRALFAHYPVHWISWSDNNLLLDIDTPDDYDKFLQLYPDEEEQA